jgi:orotate phosphoribosyltransferase
MNRDTIRARALKDLERSGVLMTEGHFDFGNGYHGQIYLNAHQLLRQPATIWRLAQDLLDLLPGELLEQTAVVAGPVTGGALLAHTMAGLLDGRRSLSHAPTLFAPFNYEPAAGLTLRDFYRAELAGKRVLLADDVRNTGETLAHCAALVRAAGGTVLAATSILDRGEAMVDLDVPHFALAEYKGQPNAKASDCPLCRDGVPITRF